MCSVLPELRKRRAVLWKRRLFVRQLHERTVSSAGLRSELQRRQCLRGRLGLRVRRMRER
jgi:hypothetical protein